jgi:hypothetical protein
VGAKKNSHSRVSIKLNMNGIFLRTIDPYNFPLNSLFKVYFPLVLSPFYPFLISIAGFSIVPCWVLIFLRLGDQGFCSLLFYCLMGLPKSSVGGWYIFEAGRMTVCGTSGQVIEVFVLFFFIILWG